jgi:hypothetical protein
LCFRFEVMSVFKKSMKPVSFSLSIFHPPVPC